MFIPIVSFLCILIALVNFYHIFTSPEGLSLGITDLKTSIIDKICENQITPVITKDQPKDLIYISKKLEQQKPVIENYEKGEVVQFSNASIKLLDIEKGTQIKSQQEYFSACESNYGILVKVTINYKNISEEPQRVSNFFLYDSLGRKFEATYTGSCLKNQIFYESINPGLELTFESLYEIPKESKGLKIGLSDSRYILLGF